MLSGLSRLAAQERVDEHRRLYQQSLRAMFLITTPAALVLAFVARPFLGVWAGSIYETHSVVPFYIILAGLWFNSLAFTPFYQLLASDRGSTIAAIHVAELLPYLIIAAALTSAFGVIGAATAWSARLIVDAVAFFFVTHRRQGLPWVPMPQRAVASIVGLICLATVLWGLSTVTSSLATRAGCSIAVLAVYGIAAWKIVLTPDERLGITTVLRAVFPERVVAFLGGIFSQRPAPAVGGRR